MDFFLLLRNKIGNYILGGLISLSTLTLLTCLWGLFGDQILPPAITARPAPNITTVAVPAPIFSERVIKTYVKEEDRAAVEALKKENERLKVDVATLSIALAQYRSQGGGAIIVGDMSTLPPSGLPEFSFTDWRLAFQGKGTSASYTLSQQFKIYNTVGKNRDGISTNLIRLYELGPKKEQLPIQTVETLTLVAPTSIEGWYAKMSVQGGWAGIAPVATSGSTSSVGTGVIAVPWLKYGKTRAVEDTRWAFFTPAVAITKTERALGILPMSFNLGTIPRQPLSDIWLSPFVGTTNGASVNRAGFVLSVTF